jgi:hypothetical protein
MTSRRSYRWLRLVLPAGVVLLLVLGSVVVYEIEEPNPGDAAYLSPVSTAGIGAKRLADRLTARGITVERATRTSDALVSAARGDATLLVTAPDLVHHFYLRMLKLMPSSTRVVLVNPGGSTLVRGLLPFGVADTTVATRVVAPGCAVPMAREAGVAAVLHTSYGVLRAGELDAATPEYRCYGGGLVSARRGGVELVAVGAADPFRNDRGREHGNATLADALLTAAPRLVWLDVHRREPQPGYVDNPALASQAPAPPSLGPGSPDPDFPLAGGGTYPEPGLSGGGEGSAPGGRGNPVWQAFPPWAYPAAALVALALVLLALARARRLGTPVTEPLPIAVRATETVEGRGRLYQRAKARGSVLETLQGAARERLRVLTEVGADRAELVAAVAAHSGWTPDVVEDALYGPAPADDKELVRAATTLDRLLQAVTGPPAPTNEGEAP